MKVARPESAVRVRLGKIRQTSGGGDARGRRFALVVSRFNAALTAALAETAVAALRECGAAARDIRVVWVPGAYESPWAVDRLAARGGVDAFIALGCVIQGETPHARLIGEQVTRALSDIARARGVPVIDGVVTANTEEQARARCRPGPHSRGRYAALAAVEMASLAARLREEEAT
jgi:6,7-dimethyl-8-ribityllumazine synthase